MDADNGLWEFVLEYKYFGTVSDAKRLYDKYLRDLEKESTTKVYATLYGPERRFPADAS